LTYAERSPWIERTGWETTYFGLDRQTLTELIRIPPVAAHLLDATDGPLESENGLFKLKDEEKIAAVLGIFDTVMDQCERTTQKTSRSLLCWLRSYRPASAYAKPFQLVGHSSTTRKYRALFKRVLALLCRAFLMLPAARDRVLGKQKLSKRQRQFLEQIWSHKYWNWSSCTSDSTHFARIDVAEGTSPLTRDDDCDELLEDEDDEDEDDDEDAEDGDEDDQHSDQYEDGDGNGDDEDDRAEGHANEVENCDYGDKEDVSKSVSDRDRMEIEVQELVFGLSLSLCTQSLANGQPSSAFLIFASGILGFSPESEAFLPARSYTPYLSGLIYIQRLLFLELALPLHDYPALGATRGRAPGC
jgi:hypothetical protein